MARENSTVLIDLLNRVENDRQLSESPVDLNTLILCTYELETSWQQLSQEYRSSLRCDRIEKFLCFMKDNQLLKAKDMSSQALGDYKDMCTLMIVKSPQVYQVKYWNELTNQQKENRLRDLALSPKSTKNTGISNDLYDETSAKLKSSKRQYVTQINITNKDRASMTGSDARQHVSSQVSCTPGIVMSSSKVESQKKLADQPHFMDRSLVKPRSTKTKPDNETLDRNIVNARMKTHRSEMVGPATQKSEQRSADTMRSPRKTDLHGRSDQKEIIEQFTRVYQKYYKPLFDSIINQQKFSSELISKELLRVVWMTAQVCKSFAEEQIRNMQMRVNKVMGDGGSTEQAKNDIDEFLFFEFRRMNAELSLGVLHQSCLEKIRRDNDIQIMYSSRETEQMFKEFLSVCVEVIWYMTVQDTPVVLEYGAATEQDEQLLFQGSKDIKQRLKYVIWPAVRSFKDGPILYMGVALFSL